MADTDVRLARPVNVPGALPRQCNVAFVSAENRYLGNRRGAIVAPDTLSIQGEPPAGAVTCNIIAHGSPPFQENGAVLAKSGRIYGLLGEPGVRDGKGYRFFTHTGAKVPLVYRVAFDDDADAGLASVSFYLSDATGQPLLDAEHNDAIQIAVRMWVQAVAPGQPDPAPAPKAVLYRTGGTIVRHEQDPVPDEAIQHAGGTVQHEEK